MEYNTVGNIIYEPISNCDCGLTGGCEKCNPLLFSQISYPIIKEEKRKCKNCGEELSDFCSRWCRVEFEF